MTQEPKLFISTIEFFAELHRRLGGGGDAPKSSLDGLSGFELRRAMMSVSAAKAAKAVTKKQAGLSPLDESAERAVRNALQTIQSQHFLPSDKVDERSLPMLCATIRARVTALDDAKDPKLAPMQKALSNVADQLEAIGKSKLAMNDALFAIPLRDYAAARQLYEGTGDARTFTREYPEGVPADVSKQVSGEHERGLLAQNRFTPVREDSLLVRDTAKFLDEADAATLTPETLPAAIMAFKVAVGEQFRTTPEYLGELNRMFETQRAGRSNVMCWTAYGLEQFGLFYGNYRAAEAGSEVEELLPRLQRATVTPEAEKEEEVVAAPRERVRVSDARPAYRRVPTPRQEEIEEGKLTGLADRDAIEEDDLSLADWSDDALIALTKESDDALKMAAEQTISADTLRVANTKLHIDLLPGQTKYAEAEGWPAAVLAFKMAVLREAGTRDVGLSELAQMFTSFRSDKGTGVISSWTPQGLHKFQIFLPRYVEAMKADHPELELPQSRETRIHALGMDVTEENFNGVKLRERKAGSDAATPRHLVPMGRSTAQEVARAIKIGYTGPKGHLSDTVYPYDPEQHFTLQELTARVSKRLSFTFTPNQVSHRVNRSIEDYAQRSRNAAKPLKRDVYVVMANTTDPYPVYYTRKAEDAVVESIVTHPPVAYTIAKKMDKGEGVDTVQVADDLGLPPDERNQFDLDLLKLMGTLPLAMRGSVRVRIDASVLSALTEEGILTEKGVDFEKAAEVFSGEQILRAIRQHFVTGHADFDAFNSLKEQYFELGHTTLPLTGIRLNGSGALSGLNLEGYDFRDCDLSGADLTFCNIGQAYIDGTTKLAAVKIDGSTLANPQQKTLYLGQQLHAAGR